METKEENITRPLVTFTKHDVRLCVHRVLDVLRGITLREEDRDHDLMRLEIVKQELVDLELATHMFTL